MSSELILHSGIMTFIGNDQTVMDVLNNLDNVSTVCITEDNIGHSYIGDADIDYMDPDILEKKVVSCLVVKHKDGYHVHLEV